MAAALQTAFGARGRRNWADNATGPQWTDLYGISHAVQATVARQPTITTTADGSTGVSFSPDGSFGANADFMLAPAAGTSATPRYTLICGVIRVLPGFAYDAVNGVAVVSIGGLAQVYIYPGIDLTLRLAGWSATAFAWSRADITDGAEHTFIGVWDVVAGTCRLYLDGATEPEDGFVAATGSPIDLSANQILIAAGDTGGVAPLQGLLADIGIAQSDAEFSTDDLAAIHAALLATPSTGVSISGSASMALAATGTLRGRGRLGGTASLALNGSGALRGAAALAGNAALTLSAAASAARGVAKVSGIATTTLGATATARGVARSSGSALLSLGGTGSLYGRGRLAGTGTIEFSALLDQGGGGATPVKIAASGGLALSGSGTPRGVAKLAANAAIALGGSGSLHGAVSMQGSAALACTAAARLTAAGKLQGDASIGLSLLGMLLGRGKLNGATSLILSGHAMGRRGGAPTESPPGLTHSSTVSFGLVQSSTVNVGLVHESTVSLGLVQVSTV